MICELHNFCAAIFQSFQLFHKGTPQSQKQLKKLKVGYPFSPEQSGEIYNLINDNLYNGEADMTVSWTHSCSWMNIQFIFLTISLRFIELHIHTRRSAARSLCLRVRKGKSNQKRYRRGWAATRAILRRRHSLSLNLFLKITDEFVYKAT